VPKRKKWPHPDRWRTKGRSLSDLPLPPKGVKLRKATPREIADAIEYHEQEAIQHFVAARVIAEVARLLSSPSPTRAKRRARR